MTAKSCVSGAPSSAAPVHAAVMPGTTSTSTRSRAASVSTSPAMPYTPASPLQITLTSSPAAARSTAMRQRSSSPRMAVATNSFSGYSGLTSSTYAL